MAKKTIANLPCGLMMMMREFTVAVLREHPEDLNQFAMDFFNSRRDKKPECVPIYVVPGAENDASAGDKRISVTGQSDAKPSLARASKHSGNESETTSVHEKTEEERNHITALVKNIIMLQSPDPAKLNRVVDAMLKMPVKKGQCIIKQGDPGDNFYVIESGEFDVIVERDGASRSVFQYKDKGFFGELALLNDEPRSATINALTDGVLYAMDVASFHIIVHLGSFPKRAMYENLLTSFPMLQKLKEAARNAITDKLVSHQYKGGICIIKEGEAPDGMYFVEEGSVRVTIKAKGKEVDVAKLGKGRYFGEKALIENSRRTASVYAVVDVNVAFLDKKSFKVLDSCAADLMEGMKGYQMSS